MHNRCGHASRRYRIAAVILLSLAAAEAHTVIAAEPAAKTAPPAVTMEAVAYAPSALVIKQGATVVWVNRDPFPHTVTAVDRSFDSRDIAAGASWKHVARRRGTFDYVCTLHPNMKGTLVVQ